MKSRPAPAPITLCAELERLGVWVGHRPVSRERATKGVAEAGVEPAAPAIHFENEENR
jgi:hypothetical protein